VRIAHVTMALGGPAAAQHLWTETDMAGFDHWARQIARGDVLSTGTQRPLTHWHRETARLYLAAHPGGGDAETLWHRWYGVPRFYQEPAYPYALAAVYALIDSDLPIPLFGQALLGLGAVALLMAVTRRLLGECEALVAGVLAALCGPAVYYDGLLLRETLSAATVWLALLAWVRVRQGTRTADAALLGLACGLAAMTRVLVAPFAVLLLVTAWRSLDARRGVALVAGLGVPLGLLAMRNLAVGVPPLSIAWGGTMAFVATNAAGSDPWWGLIHDPALIARLMAESDGSPLHLVWASLASHDNVGSWLLLEAKKVAVLMHDWEVPNNASFDFYAAHTRLLRALPVTFAVVLPLGVAGAFVALRQRRGRILVALAALQVAVVLVLTPLSRFRIALCWALLPLGALALAAGFDAWRAGRRGRVSATALVVIATWLAMHRPLPPGVLRVRPVDHQTAWSYWARPRLEAAQIRRDLGALAAAMRDFVRGEPEDLAVQDPQTLPDRRHIAMLYARAHDLLAQAALEIGDSRQATAERQRAAALGNLTR
jgi:4-amino-4-deoxy-L-arabinose transferase-like glycosyltransferase